VKSVLSVGVALVLPATLLPITSCAAPEQEHTSRQMTVSHFDVNALKPGPTVITGFGEFRGNNHVQVWNRYAHEEAVGEQCITVLTKQTIGANEVNFRKITVSGILSLGDCRSPKICTDPCQGRRLSQARVLSR
jgi:hypothetical protein